MAQVGLYVTTRTASLACNSLSLGKQRDCISDDFALEFRNVIYVCLCDVLSVSSIAACIGLQYLFLPASSTLRELAGMPHRYLVSMQASPQCMTVSLFGSEDIRFDANKILCAFPAQALCNCSWKAVRKHFNMPQTWQLISSPVFLAIPTNHALPIEIASPKTSMQWGETQSAYVSQS